MDASPDHLFSAIMIKDDIFAVIIIISIINISPGDTQRVR